MAKTTGLVDQLPDLASMVADQAGTVTRTVLRLHGIDDAVVRRQVAARRWQEAGPQVVVDRGVRPAPLDFVKIHESRRHQGADVMAVHGLPCHKVERAAIDVASWCPSVRTAVGVLAAVVQQRLTSPTRLHDTLERQGRIRRRRLIAATINDLAGGAQALSEIDGMGHLEPNRWYADLLRVADITATDETPILRLPAAAARIDEKLLLAPGR